MPYRSIEQRKQYQRDWLRSKRLGEPTRIETRHRVLSIREIETANALLSILAGQIKAVMVTKEGDTFIRARTIGYLVAIALKAVETVDLDQRLEALEKKINLGGVR